ncbi:MULTISPECIES: hypothetical protein [unclassified Exiguobacterium]|uniref:hypothetical protein n=1 Tax=unclassified Exiguobacterium TaxID=2644629 RepID=UPI001BE77465|nr:MULTISPECIES: hypothetical protein [unclassified Exiguobacterium]
MELSAIIEVIRINQEVHEEMVALEHAIIHSPDSARQIGSSASHRSNISSSVRTSHTSA